MSFRKLLDMTDKIAREELGNYYIISESRMNNYLDCLESGAKQIQQLTETIEQYKKQIYTLESTIDYLESQIQYSG